MSPGRENDLVEMEGRFWIPVEATAMRGSFLDAWESAAETISAWQAQARAATYSTASAHALYEPVSLKMRAERIGVVDHMAVAERVRTTIGVFVDREVSREEVSLRERVSAESERTENRIGAVYARFGRYAGVEHQFRLAVEMNPNYGAGWANLGHLAMIEGDCARAVSNYARAQDLGVTAVSITEAIIDAYRGLGDHKSAIALSATRNAEETEVTQESLASDSASRGGEIDGLEIIWVDE